MKTFIVVLVIVAALVAGGWFAVQRLSENEAPPAMAAAEARVGTLRLSVASTGRVVSNLDVDIKCKASGEVVSIPFDVSDSVKKGALLLRLDPVDEDRVEKQAEVSLSAAQAKLRIAKRNLEIATDTLKTDRKRADAGINGAAAEAKNAHAQANRQEQLLKTKSGMAADRDAAVAVAAKADAELDIARIHLEELTTQELGLDLRKQEIEIGRAHV